MKVATSSFSAGKPPTATPLKLAIGSPAELGPTNAPLYPQAVSRLEAPKPVRKYASSTRKIAFQVRSQKAFPGVSI